MPLTFFIPTELGASYPHIPGVEIASGGKIFRVLTAGERRKLCSASCSLYRSESHLRTTIFVVCAWRSYYIIFIDVGKRLPGLPENE